MTSFQCMNTRLLKHVLGKYGIMVFVLGIYGIAPIILDHITRTILDI